MAKPKSTGKRTKKATPKAKAKGPDAATLLKLAGDGDVDGIFEAVGELPEEERDVLAYRWLCVAADRGHDDAADAIDDMHESSTFRYDDDQMLAGSVYFELGGDYLDGGDGLPIDVELAKQHLADARRRGYPWSVQESKALIADLRKRAGKQAALVDELFAKRPADDEVDDGGGDDE